MRVRTMRWRGGAGPARRGSRWATTALVLTALWTATGCQVPRQWRYSPSGARSYESLPLVAGVVVPFDDQRPSPSQDSNTVPLGLLPLVLWGTSTSHQPEIGYARHEESILAAAEIAPREREIMRALDTVRDSDERARLQGELRGLREARQAKMLTASGASLPEAASLSLFLELRAAQLFADVVPVRSAVDRGGCDVILQGELIRTEQRRGVIWYGLSLAGPVLWLVGLPPNTHHMRTAWRVRVLDYRGRALDEFEYHAVAPTRVAWRWGAYYYQSLPALWAEMNRTLVREMTTFFSQRPRDYWESYASEAAVADVGRPR